MKPSITPIIINTVKLYITRIIIPYGMQYRRVRTLLHRCSKLTYS